MSVNFSGKVTAKRIVDGDEVNVRSGSTKGGRSGNHDDKDRGRSDKDVVGRDRVDNR